MTERIFSKLLLGLLAVVLLTTVTLDLFVNRSWRNSLRAEKQRNLQHVAQMVAERLRAGQPASGAVDFGGRRVTLVAPDGRVLADSESDPRSMENHASRPEVAAALGGRPGSDTRRSATTGVEYLYVAIPHDSGALRLAEPLAILDDAMEAARKDLLVGTLLAIVVAVAISALLARSVASRLQRIVSFADRIAGGDFAARLEESSRDEIGKVAAALDRTAHQLELSFRKIEESRAELESLLNSIQDPVLAVDAKARVLWANGRMLELTGREARVGSRLVECLRDPAVLQALQAAVATRSPQTGQAAVVAAARSYRVHAAPMPNGGAVAVLLDVTEMEKTEKTRRDFIANVTHELRTPLTSIRGYSETLLDAAAMDAPYREFLEIIRKNAARMSRLTDDLLVLARVESGEQRFMFAPVTPQELLSPVLDTFRSLAAHQGVELLCENQAQQAVMADANAVHQVFSNLVDNAIKYVPSGSTVTIGATDVTDAVEFFVRDTGHGIASEHLPRLFERFYRVDRARSIESGGTGLGLAIAKHIVLAHGGRIWAESELNHGATFRFRLPLAESVAAVRQG